MVQVVKAAFAAEQAPIVHSNVVAFSSEDDFKLSVAISESPAFADAQALGPHTSPLLDVV